MRFDYTLTVEDLREMMRPTTPDGRPAARRTSLSRGLFGWVVFLLLAMMLSFLLTIDNRPGIKLPPPPQSLWVTLVPSVAPAGAFVMIVVVSTVRQRARTRRTSAAVSAGRPVPPAGKVPPWAVWASISPVAFIAVPLVPALAVTWSPTPDAALRVGLLPWVVALVVAGVALIGARRSAADHLWAATPALRRRLTADVSDAGIWESDGVCDTLYRWPAVTRYRETDHLLVLTLEDARMLVLPKRAVPDAGDDLRGLIQTHVADGSFLPRSAAFPVLEVAAK